MKPQPSTTIRYQLVATTRGRYESSALLPLLQRARPGLVIGFMNVNQNMPLPCCCRLCLCSKLETGLVAGHGTQASATTRCESCEAPHGRWPSWAAGRSA